MATVDEIKDELHQEGYTKFEIVTDPPGKFYPDHIHEHIVPYVILEGEMTLTVNTFPQILKPGSRYDVPAHMVHSARIGMEGCTYLIAEVE